MNNRIPQSPSELEAHLKEQVHFIEVSARAFDNGDESEAKRLALPIRKLVHDTKTSHSLLSQLNKKNIKYYDTSLDVEPDISGSFMGLVSLSFGSGKFIPNLDDVDEGRVRWVDFDSWWNKSIFKDQDGKFISRKDLILWVANQDGGAHIDPELDETYANLSRRNSLGWIAADDAKWRNLDGAERAAIRQIAHEILKSLNPAYTIHNKSELQNDIYISGGIKLVTAPVNQFKNNPKVGRNEPCPCGSGNKYKKCHGK